MYYLSKSTICNGVKTTLPSVSYKGFDAAKAAAIEQAASYLKGGKFDIRIGDDDDPVIVDIATFSGKPDPKLGFEAVTWEIVNIESNPHSKLDLIRRVVEAQYNVVMRLHDLWKESEPEEAKKEMLEAVTLDGVLALFRDDDHLRKIAEIYGIAT